MLLPIKHCVAGTKRMAVSTGAGKVQAERNGAVYYNLNSALNCNEEGTGGFHYLPYIRESMSEIKPINILPFIALSEWICSLSRSSSFFMLSKDFSTTSFVRYIFKIYSGSLLSLVWITKYPVIVGMHGRMLM